MGNQRDQSRNKKPAPPRSEPTLNEVKPPSQPRRLPTGEWLPFAVLAGLTVIFWGDLIFGGKVLAMRDMFCDFVPWQIFSARAFAAGHLPLWDPHIGYGQPFAAEPLTGVFYPLNWLFSVISIPWALKVCWTVHLWIGASAMYALARYWKLDKVPALIAGVGYAFGTFLMGNLEFIANLAGAVWGPLVLLLVCRLVDLCSSSPPGRPGRLLRAAALLALVLALQYLAGYPEFSAQAVVMSGVYIIVRSIYLRSGRTFIRSMAWFAVAGILAVGMVLPQFLATFDLMIHHSARASGVDLTANITSAHPKQILTLLLPFLYGDAGYHGHYWAKTIYEFWLGTFYVGILPVLTCGLAVFFLFPAWRHTDPQRRFLTVLSLVLLGVGLMMAAGIYFPLAQFVHDHVPGFSRFRYPAKYFNWVTYGLPLLGGLGYQALSDPNSSLRGKRGRIGIISAGVLLLLGLIGGYLGARNNGDFLQWLTGEDFVGTTANIQLVLHDFLWAILFTSLSLAVIIARLYRPTTDRWLDGAAIAVLFLNLLCITRQVQPVLPDAFYKWDPEFPLANAIDPQKGRVMSTYEVVQQLLYGSKDEKMFKWARVTGTGNTWLPFQIYQTSEGGIRIERFLTFQRLMQTQDQWSLERLGNVGSVRYIVGGDAPENILWKNAPKNVYVKEKPDAMPRAYLLTHWTIAPDPARVMDQLLAQSFTPTQDALVEPVSMTAQAGISTNATMPQPASLEATPAQAVSTLNDTLNSLELTNVIVTQPSLLVLTDIWYPGWQAKVDGKDEPIYRVNFLFRGIFLQPGTHTVVYSYRPWQFSGTTFAISGGFVLLVLGLIVWGRRKAGETTTPVPAVQ